MLSLIRPPGRVALVLIFRSVLALGVLFSIALGAARANAQVGETTARLMVVARVTDQDSNQQIEQVRLELVLFPDRVVQLGFTDGSGKCEFGGVTPQMYHLRATKMDYQPAEVLVDPGATPRGSSMSLTVEVQMRRKDLPSTAPGGVVSKRELSLPPAAVEEFHEGVELLSVKKDPKASIEHFQKAIDGYAGYYEAYFLMGMAQLQTGDSAKSERSLSKAIELNPKFLEPYYPLSAALHALNRDADAEATLEKARALDTAGWRWPFELARLQGNHQEWAKAIPLAQEAASKTGAPPKVHLLLADLYSNTGQRQKALQELETFAKLDPSSNYLPRVQAAMEKLRQPN